MNDSAAENDRNLAALVHAGGIVFGFIPSLIVWLVNKDKGGFLADQAKEALNFQITVFVAVMASWVLMFLLIGMLILPVVVIGNLVLSIVAAVKVSKGEDYRYPFALRLLK